MKVSVRAGLSPCAYRSRDTSSLEANRLSADGSTGTSPRSAWVTCRGGDVGLHRGAVDHDEVIRLAQAAQLLLEGLSSTFALLSLSPV
jgi:hypothetical protein